MNNNQFLLFPLLAMICWYCRGDSLQFVDHGRVQFVDQSKNNHSVAFAPQHPCYEISKYYLTNEVYFKFCLAHNERYLTDGNSIVKLVRLRGFLPSCRVLHLLHWMHVAVESHFPSSDNLYNSANHSHHSHPVFADIGANIGSCTMHMAFLGFPVVSVDPVWDHVEIMKLTHQLNPSFRIDIFHGLVAYPNRVVKAKIFHRAKDWGSTTIEEIGVSAPPGFINKRLPVSELSQITLSTLLRKRKHIGMVKLDCEGCEYDALMGGREVLSRIPILKIEIAQAEYYNRTFSYTNPSVVNASEILRLLDRHGFDIFADIWVERSYYQAQLPDEITDFDKMFGSHQYNIPFDAERLHTSARQLLSHPIDVPSFSYEDFAKKYDDIIAIQRDLVKKMRSVWKV